MRSTGNANGRYYEHYQVEDVLTFFSGQLISAKSPDGMQVLLQEISLKDPLPPGLAKVLTNLENEHLAPILDVIEEPDRIVLVHPPLTGEPLSLMIRPRQGMEPAQALSVYRQLLRTTVRLSKLPIPLYTILDPRNIIMEGSRPFVLFVSFEKLSKMKDDVKWRFLLHFLLTGFQLERWPEEPESERSIRELPKPMKDLVLKTMDPEQSMEQVLEAAEKTVPPKGDKPSSKKRPSSVRKWVYPGIAVVLLVAGVVAGNEFIFNNNGAAADEEDAEKQLSIKGKGTYSDVSFMREKPTTQALPPSIDTSFRLTGEFSQKEHKPFSLAVVSENVESDFGVRITRNGKVKLFQYVNGETFDLTDSGDSFSIQPSKKYQLEVIYLPGQPFRISLSEKGTGQKWVAVGQVPMDSVFKVEMKGVKGTRFANPEISRIDSETESLVGWMEGQPWVLVDGDGILYPDRFEVGTDARVHVNQDQSSFSFKRGEDFAGDPLRMEMESVTGERYTLSWMKNGLIELSRVGYETEKLGSGYLGTKWDPTKDSGVSITSDSSEFSIELTHQNVNRKIETHPDKPVSLRRISIVTQSEITLMKDKSDSPEIGNHS
ncbi:hypothetical protein ACFQ49_08465 [Kroppenstedtia eburnea]|uniref:Uncharacterized protein n=1 Tax=Kroppenstedtia eburnea TaxID=714067 RepID=A0A1N7IL40_9BACL|nr:hypothetical protein [Kroppenstedtia eburnea]QKI81913.1 hypothetical protein GXN75_07815 [Kroppenstedtia eburnea]SIS37691.1 hypothetical protein SAMN05421790_10141 [Kroppenstedtia eburnea]